MSANEQTPTATDAGRSEFDLEPAQFRELIETLRNQFNQLVTLNQEVAVLPRGRKLEYPDGRLLGRRDLNTLNSQFGAALRRLPRYFTEAKKRRRRPRAGGRDQFRTPAFITGELLEFFRNADFGPAYIIDENDNCTEQGPLRDYLELFLTEGITAGLLLTSLFSIYARHNRIQDPQRASVYVATDDMRQYLADTFNTLYERDVAAPRSRKATKNDLEQNVFVDEVGQRRVQLPPFDPNNITFSDFQRITALSRLRKNDLNEEQIARLEDEQIKERIAQEVDIVTSTLACLKRFAEAAAPPKQTGRRGRARAQGVTSPGAQRNLPAIPQQQVAPSIQPVRRAAINPQGGTSPPLPSISNQVQGGTLGRPALGGLSGLRIPRAGLPTLNQAINQPIGGDNQE